MRWQPWSSSCSPITSAWQRRSISGFCRCTEAKSSSSWLSPLAIEQAQRAGLEGASDASAGARLEALLPPVRRVLAAAVVAGTEVEAHLMTEHRERPGTGPVVLLDSFVEDSSQQVVILEHQPIVGRTTSPPRPHADRTFPFFAPR